MDCVPFDKTAQKFMAIYKKFIENIQDRTQPSQHQMHVCLVGVVRNLQNQNIHVKIHKYVKINAINMSKRLFYKVDKLCLIWPNPVLDFPKLWVVPPRSRNGK